MTSDNGIKILRAHSGDWIAVYLNNEKDQEGHSLDSEYWFDLGQRFPDIKWDDIDNYYVDSEAAEEDGVNSFPDDFNDLLEKYYEK